MRFLRKWRFLLIKFFYKHLGLAELLPPPVTRIDLGLNQIFCMYLWDFKDQIACHIYKYGWQDYEKPLGKVIVTLVKNKRIIFIDVGANTGFYSLLASAVGAIKVHAYEPIPDIAEMFRKNLVQSNFSHKIMLHEMAVSNQIGMTEIYVPLKNAKYIETSASINADFKGSKSEVLKIPTTSLDAIRAIVDSTNSEASWVLIKIDVESYELPVLSGGLKLLREVKPIIVIELLADNRDREQIEKLFIDLSYICYGLNDAGPIRIKDISTSSSSDNYIFVPVDKVSEFEDITQ